MITFIYSAQYFFLAKFSNGDCFFHPNVSHIIFQLTEPQKKKINNKAFFWEKNKNNHMWIVYSK